jgi:type I restriction enzyme S subunit
MSKVDSLRTETKFKRTEIGEIPVDWEFMSLGEISDDIYRYPTYYNIEYVEKGIPEVRGELIRSNGALEKNLSLYRFISEETASKFPRTRLTEGDFVISVRGTMGKIAMIPKSLEGANITANLIRISPNRRIIHAPWLNQIFLSKKFQQELNNASSSTTIKTIKAPEIKSFKLAVPPIFEQRKIADIFSAVDEAIEKKNEIIEKTKRMKKGLMQELLSRGIGHTKFKKTEISEIPVHWRIRKLSEIGRLKGGSGFPEKYQGYPDREYSFIKVSDMNLPGNEIYIKNSTNTIDLNTTKELGCHIFPNDTIIFAKVGAALLLNRRRILTKESCLDNNMMGLEISKENDPRFYYHIMQTIDFADYVFSGALPSVNQAVLGNIKVVNPLLNEQSSISRILMSIDENIGAQNAYLKEIEKIKIGLTLTLLTGKVRVRY